MSISTQLINTLFVPICLFFITFCNVSKYYPISKYNSTVPPFFWDTVPTSRQPAIPGYQNITFDDSIIKLCNSNITVTVLLLHLLVPLFFLTFNGSILTLCSSNITCNNFFVTFGSSFFFFFSHLTISSSHCVVPTSLMTVLLSHLMVYLFFFLTFDSPILTSCSSKIICDNSFVTFAGSFFFFLTFDGSILILCSTNITFDNTFVTFSGSLKIL